MRRDDVADNGLHALARYGHPVRGDAPPGPEFTDARPAPPAGGG